MEAVYITVAVLTGVAGLGGLTYKCRQNIQCNNQEQRITVTAPTPCNSPTNLDHIVKEVLEQNLSPRNSDETDIDIKIHIENKMREKAVFPKE